MVSNRGYATLATIIALAGGPLMMIVVATITGGNNLHLGQVMGIQFKPSPTPTPSVTPTPTPTPTMTPTPKPTPTPTPKPTPTPTPIPVTGEDLDRWFTDYANHYSIDRELLRRIAHCESKFKVNATNGPYAGLYQFNTSTWIATRRAMNLDPNPDLRFNPEEAIRTAAFKIATSGTRAWPVCGK